MLKLNLRKLAASAVALGAFAALTAAAQTPGITEGDSQPAPRRSSPSTGDTAPEFDSRAGGELGTGAGRTAAGNADAADDASDPEDVKRRTFTGLVTSVSEDRITLSIDPPGGTPTAQTFRLGDGANVIVNGEPADFRAVRKGQVVRLITAPGDPEMAVRLFATSRRARSERDENFDVYPQADQDTPPRRPEEQAGGPDRRRPAMAGGEEAVLPLGIEVYGGGRQGALVTEMLAGGPAATAGVLINDLIVAVNGQTVGDPELIEQQLASTGDGSAELTVVRNGETLQLPITPGQLVEGSLTNVNAMRQALVTAGFIAGGGLRNNGGVVETGTPGTGANGIGTGGVNLPPADANGGAPGLTPRSPGRSDAAEGGTSPGRSDAAPGRQRPGRNGATGNNSGTGTNGAANGTGTNAAGSGAAGTNAGGTATGGTRTGGTGTNGAGGT
jgi:membrane-associated protease RseP (regulator of RpoE activity)